MITEAREIRHLQQQQNLVEDDNSVSKVIVIISL